MDGWPLQFRLGPGGNDSFIKQEADGNSGVFFRSSIEGTRISGWQVEVAPPGNDTGGIYESYGRG